MASISSVAHAAFAGGWQYFTYSTMRNHDYKNDGKNMGNSFVI